MAQTKAETTIQTLQNEVTQLKAQLNMQTDNSQLLEAQQLVTQKQAELDRLRSDYNALQRLVAEIKSATKVVIA